MARSYATIKNAEDKSWAVDDAVRTLIEANRIKKDKALMKAVRPKLKEMAEAAKAAAKSLKP